MVTRDQINWPNAMERIVCKTANEIAFKESELFITLSGCQCCYRHMVNKPKELYKGWEDCFSANPHRDKSNDCLCHCRHTARMMARAYNENSIPWYAHYKDTKASSPKRPKTSPRKHDEKKADEYQPRGPSPSWTPGWHNY